MILSEMQQIENMQARLDEIEAKGALVVSVFPTREGTYSNGYGGRVNKVETVCIVYRVKV